MTCNILGKEVIQDIFLAGLVIDSTRKIGVIGSRLGDAAALDKYLALGEECLRVYRQQRLLDQNLLTCVLRMVVKNDYLVNFAREVMLHSIVSQGISLFDARISGQVAEGKHRIDTTILEVADRLLATCGNSDLLALCLALLHDLLGTTKHAGIEATSQTAVGGDDHNKGLLNLVMRRRERCSSTAHACDVGQHLLHSLAIRRSSFDTLGRMANLCSCDHLHGTRDLLRRFDGLDSPFNIVKVGHSDLPYAMN